MNEGHAFQFTPDGIIPLGAAAPAQPGDYAGADPRPQPAHPQAVSATPPTSVARVLAAGQPGRVAILDPSKPMTGRELLAQARARVKEIDRQLRSVPALQDERARLSALIEAARAAVPRRRKAH